MRNGLVVILLAANGLLVLEMLVALLAVLWQGGRCDSSAPVRISGRKAKEPAAQPKRRERDGGEGIGSYRDLYRASRQTCHGPLRPMPQADML